MPRPDPAGAVVLLSGGLDSAVCLAVALASRQRVLPLVFDYGQQNARELDHARQIATHYALEPLEVRLDMRAWGGSELTGTSGATAYVPARNLIFLAVAVSVAEAHGLDRVYFGAGAQDAKYPDCRPSFFHALQTAADLATRSAEGGTPIHVRTPLLGLSKEGIVRAGLRLGAPVHLTWSCHRDGPVPCGECAACELRIASFADLGVADPAATGA
jgi:7-cyano-7-deazaguanine synthase